jgi:HD superfamily phosphohydrolase
MIYIYTDIYINKHNTILHSHLWFIFSCIHIQGDSGENVNIFEGDNFGRCQKKVHINTCLILNGYEMQM